MSMFSNYDQRLLDHVTKLHFIGCGGSGMFPLIQILAAKGYQITGSDVLDGSIIQAERAMGIRVTLGHDANNIVGADMVVYSAAIPKDNVELAPLRATASPRWSAASCWATSAACTRAASAWRAPTARPPPLR